MANKSIYNKNINYKRKNEKKVEFKEIKDGECFYDGDVLFMRIAKRDLIFFNIQNVNAISIINAGLTFFDDDEKVKRATKDII